MDTTALTDAMMRYTPTCKHTQSLLKLPTELWRLPRSREYLMIKLGRTSGWFDVRVVTFETTDDSKPKTYSEAVQEPFASVTRNSDTYAAMNLRTVPGATTSEARGSFALPISHVSCLYILHHWKLSNVLVDGPTEQVIEAVLEQLQRQTYIAEVNAKFVATNEVPDLGPDYSDGDLPLSPYQRTALWTLQNSGDGCALFMEQGTGKTACVVRHIEMQAMKKHARGEGTYRVLIVCPKTVRDNWAREIAKFTVNADAHLHIIAGQFQARLQQLVAIHRPLDVKFAAAIAGYETITNMQDAFSLLKWDLIVLDESHFIKSTKSIRTKYILSIREQAVERIIMTGTPLGNNVADIWPQLEFMRKGSSGFPTIAAFNKFFAPYDERASKMYGVGSINNLPFLQERINQSAFIITKKAALPWLPEKTYDIMTVEMDMPQQQAYVQLQNLLTAELEREITHSDRPIAVVAQNILVQLLRLAQITSGFTIGTELAEDGDMEAEIKHKLIEFEHSPKLDMTIDAVADYLRTHPNSKVQIWAVFIHDIKKLCQGLREAGIECVSMHGADSSNARQRAVAQFNTDPICRVIVGHPVVGGMGINLLGHDSGEGDMNCDWVIYYSQGWSLINRLQSEDRSHRFGTRVSVRYTDMHCTTLNGEPTIDSIIHRRLQSKQNMMTDIMDVRNIMAQILGGELCAL